MQTIIHIFDSLDPFFNLALEDGIFRNLQAHQQVLLIYRNRPCVVMGRFQSPWAEINFPLLHQNSLPLVRRFSGGGCVYHDDDNLNFSFLGHRSHFQVEKNLEVLFKALAHFQLVPERGEHFSLAMDGHKFSGSSFKNIKNYQLHHGTLLIKANSNFIEQLLTPQWMISKTVALASRRTKVAGLGDFNRQVNLRSLQNALVASYQEVFGAAQLLPAPVEKLNALTLQQLQSFAWVWKETPFSTQYFCHPNFQVNLQVKKMQILACYLECPSPLADYFPAKGQELVGIEMGSEKWQRFWESLGEVADRHHSLHLRELAWHLLPLGI